MSIKTNKSKHAGYLLISILCFFISVYLVYENYPNFIYLIEGYPTLDKSEVIEGTISVEKVRYGGLFRRGNGGYEILTNNYLVNGSGKKYKLNYLTDRYNRKYKVIRFHNPIFNGTKAKVWLNPSFGVIQAEYQKSTDQQKAFREALPRLFKENVRKKMIKKNDLISDHLYMETILVDSNNDSIRKLNFSDSYSLLKKLNTFYLSTSNEVYIFLIFNVACCIATFVKYRNLKHY